MGDRPYWQSLLMTAGTLVFCMSLELGGAFVFGWQPSKTGYLGMMSMIALERTYRRRGSVITMNKDGCDGRE